MLLSKPPAPRVAEAVLERLARSPKRSVVCFLGLDKPGLARTLHEAAEMATGKKIEGAGSETRRVRGRVEGVVLRGYAVQRGGAIFRRRGLAGHRFVDLGDDRFTRGRPIP